MASNVDYCNMALGALGQTVTIQSIGEASKAGRVFGREYTHVLQELLASHPWPFALRAVALAQVSDTPFPGYAYQYAYPTGCLRAWRVCTADGVRTQMALLSAGELTPRPMVQPVPFQIVHGTQQTGIATDLEEAWLIYTYQAEEGRFPPLFGRAFAWALAQAAAMPITVEPAIMQNAREQATLAALVAQAEAHNEGIDDPAPITPSLAARG